MKVAAQRWNVVDSKLKEKLIQEYAQETVTYNKLKDLYEQNLTPEQIKIMKEATISDHESKEERKIKKVCIYLRYI